IENRVNMGNPINLIPLGTGIILAVGPVKHVITESFSLEGIALGTIVVLGGYHLVRALAPEFMKRDLELAPVTGDRARGADGDPARRADE
ncbi:MAG: nitrate reductase, partial [Pseudonocardia sp.]|nr:nitrate reductase [Pseudonocardia sp.]